jgi:glycosyltransferase 2 family protein
MKSYILGFSESTSCTLEGHTKADNEQGSAKELHMGLIFQWFTRWGILIATGCFLAKALSDNWKGVSELQLQPQAWMYIGGAIAIAVAAQLWSAIVWSLILGLLRQPVPKRWAMIALLQNAPAKYIPGSIWHLYGRVKAAQRQGVGLEFATLSVMLEPLFIMAGALGLALLNRSSPNLLIVCLLSILLAVHPIVLNRLWQFLRRRQGKESTAGAMSHYPLSVLLGALAFMGLRSATFICVVFAFTPITWHLFQPLMSGFSFAWLMSLVIPSPGGLGVFEASALKVLDVYLQPGLLLGCVTVYRLVTICAELIGAGVAYAANDGKMA